MKRKMILALLAAMTLTVGSVGTVFATGNEEETINQNQSEEHVHTWGEKYYVIDQESKPPYWIENEPVRYETVCYTCYDNGIITYISDLMTQGEDVLADHLYQHMIQDGTDGAYGDAPIALNEERIPDAIYVPPVYEEGHWEQKCSVCGEIINADTGEVITSGTVPEPETPNTETPENPDIETPINPDIEQPVDPDQNTPANPDSEQPVNPDSNTPANPDSEQPEKPDTNTPTNPDTENPDTETPVNPGTDTEKPSGDNTQNPTEDTEKPANGNEGGQDQTDQNKTETPQNTAEETTATENKNTNTQDTVKGEEVTQVNTQTETTESTESGEKKSPKTGDPANFIYLATLAGSALTGGTAFGLRKKFKK